MSEDEKKEINEAPEEQGTGPAWNCGDEKSENAWWEERSLPVKILMGIGFGILGAGFLILLIFVVMWLWNWLMPDIFGLKTINFWKSAGIMALSFILFKSWGSGKNERRKDKKRRRYLKQYMQEEQA